MIDENDKLEKMQIFMSALTRLGTMLGLDEHRIQRGSEGESFHSSRVIEIEPMEFSEIPKVPQNKCLIVTDGTYENVACAKHASQWRVNNVTFVIVFEKNEFGGIHPRLIWCLPSCDFTKLAQICAQYHTLMAKVMIR